MQRRTFLQSVALSSLPLLSGSLANSCKAEEKEQRFGDLLIRPQSTDHLDILFTPSRPRTVRLLQLADTHFHPGDGTNKATEEMLRGLVDRVKPDFIIHTGDFVNNDSSKPVEWTGMDILNGLQVPWTLCFGNHDYPVKQAEGSLPLDDIRQKMERGFQGYHDAATGRHYCYRYDIMDKDNPQPRASLFFFQVGYAPGDRRISDPQLAWFRAQMERDAQRQVKSPITVFVHIPLKEYHDLFESGQAEGDKAEKVCFDSDTGQSFQDFSASGRVVGVFCGHDHVNNYHGKWQGIELAYGRVSGWGGYGPPAWKRGGRLIELDLQSPEPRPQHTEVF
ncbi:metallophosphoesterase [Schlesneria sp.]|uniref:metallophosphoesterase n=1 Tax=Schlesneria sp. TaxID=2762018 RepID=UPI002EDF1452